ncbi:protein translocase SEC61 complex subunit gamma [archaeon]|jgi:protein translocase SEC61 complex gamma subunit|nr:protein translocase SEC61 complex subunit gamma [archaeon]MBT6182729.1 protein translocase SEC61 complex subunit gamma [archaeon]MBT6606159.1 protein translocase SEC61 complex subunit gamma [archaeon]MBT7252001.1 protein translocase SEC61 complex subunit gamma [archaeon]MBT7660933.1 protein translocase SEC61 complex subunit gamma [archaeon]
MAKKIIRSIKSKYTQYSRVWRLLKKPSMTEFKTISKVTAVGLLVIGALGFVISIAMTLAF